MNKNYLIFSFFLLISIGFVFGADVYSDNGVSAFSTCDTYNVGGGMVLSVLDDKVELTNVVTDSRVTGDTIGIYYVGSSIPFQTFSRTGNDTSVNVTLFKGFNYAVSVSSNGSNYVRCYTPPSFSPIVSNNVSWIGGWATDEISGSSYIFNVLAVKYVVVPTVLTDHIIGYYPMDEVSTGNVVATVGLVNGSESDTAIATGILGNGRTSTNSNANILFSNTNMISTNSFTYNMWVKPVDSGYQSIITNIGKDFRIFSAPSTDSIRLYYWNNGVTCLDYALYPTNFNNGFNVSNLYDGNFHMFTYSYNGSIGRKYYDGLPLDNQSCVVDLSQGLHNIYLGYNSGQNAWAVGSIFDEFLVYDRVINDGEVSMLFNGGSGLNPFNVSLPCSENWSQDSPLACNGIISNFTILYSDSNMCGTNVTLPINNGSVTSCCVENFVQHNSSCNGVNYTILYNDSNFCGSNFTLPINNGSIISCVSSGSPVFLGVAMNFSIIGQTAITDATPSTSHIVGDISINPNAGSFITDVSCSRVVGNIFDNNGGYTGGFDSNVSCLITNATMTLAVQSAMVSAYNDARGRINPNFTDLNAGHLAGLTLTAGLYKWSSTVDITNDVILDCQGNANAVFIFQGSSTLGLTSGKRVNLTGGCLANNIFWQMDTAVTLGTYSHFEGSILSGTAITVMTGASVNGRLFGQSAVTLDSNNVTLPSSIPSCIPNWINSNVSCNGIISNFSISYSDLNVCNVSTNLPVNNGTIFPCCVENFVQNNSVCDGFHFLAGYIDLDNCNTTFTLPSDNGLFLPCVLEARTSGGTGGNSQEILVPQSVFSNESSMPSNVITEEFFLVRWWHSFVTWITGWWNG